LRRFFLVSYTIARDEGQKRNDILVQAGDRVNQVFQFLLLPIYTWLIIDLPFADKDEKAVYSRGGAADTTTKVSARVV
jgi:hypothetical protein